MGQEDPRLSIEALIRAATQSKGRGTINLFANALAADEEQLIKAASLINDKDLKVNVFKTAARRQRKRSADRYKQQDKEDAESEDVHQYITAISGGQNLDVDPTDLSSIHSIIVSSFKPSTSTIFQQTGPAGTHTVEFQVDSTVTEFQFTVNGESPTLVALLTPGGM